jgi:hypothetical protein
MNISVGYDDRPYLIRVSPTLLSKLSNAASQGNVDANLAVYHRNVFAVLDALENHGNPSIHAYAMKMPGLFNGDLKDFEHMHYSSKVDDSYFRNLERIYKLKFETVKTPDDIAKLIVSGVLPPSDELFKKMSDTLSGKEGYWTGHWLIYKKGSDGKYRYLDTMEHIDRDPLIQKQIKQHLDTIFNSMK